MRYSRRKFLQNTGAVGAAALAVALTPSSALAEVTRTRFRRHSVTSAAGQRMLKSYAAGIKAMLELPPSHPHNWFRNAFVHFLDCPHGNWWFYVWHRGYIGYLEQIIRKLSKDRNFALPFWDWTTTPELPKSMFDGLLTPTDAGYSPYTGNLEKFTKLMKPEMEKYFAALSPEQLKQLASRGYTSFDQVWNDVTGYNPADQSGISGNMAFAITCGARYPSVTNRKLNPSTAHAVSPTVVTAGLEPQLYYDQTIGNSFTSSKTESHLMQPNSKTEFSVLEGQPHNLVHNYIGGVGPLDPGPYGNMTNFLSPVDPIFFLHHANMDRLWDVWTRQQQKAGRPIAPTGSDLEPFMNEPFLFFVDLSGKTVSGKAADYFSTKSFGYDYGAGFGDMAKPRANLLGTSDSYSAKMSNGAAVLELPQSLIKSHVANMLPSSLIAEITLERPSGLGGGREFDVLLNAPENLPQAQWSNYTVGTIAFFGPPMSHHPGMSHITTFLLPLSRSVPVLQNLTAADAAKVNLRVVPRHGRLDKPVVVREIVLRVGK